MGIGSGGTPMRAARNNDPGWLQWVAVLALILLVLCLVWLVTPSARHAPHIQTLREATASLQPEGATAEEKTLRLPFQWDSVHPGQSGTVRLTLHLPVLDADVPHALYLPRVGNQGVVSDTLGKVLARWGRFGDATTDSSRLPRLVYLSHEAVQARQAVIDLSIQPARSGGLGQVHVGPAEQVVHLFERHYYWRVYGSLVLAANLLLLSIFSLGVWWFRRDPLAVDLGWGGLFGTLAYLARVMETPPLPWPWWGAVVSGAIVLHLMFIWRVWVTVFDANTRWTQPRWFYGVMVVWLLLTGLAFYLGQSAIWSGVLLTTYVLSGSSFVWVLRQICRRNSPHKLAHLALHLLLIALLTWDLVAGRIYGDGVGSLQLAPLATLIVIGVFAFLLIHRFSHPPHPTISTLTALEDGRQLERQRIMRDLHDGVGGNLVGLRQMLVHADVSRTELIQQMDSVLDEMRMTIDALQPSHDDLITILATLRYRLQPRLDAAGIRVVWSLPEVTPELLMPPEHIFHVQKIVMEALTNVQKHSGARHVWVQLEVPSTFVKQGHAVITIEDDGCGLGATYNIRVGMGLQNMRARAQSIGAELTIGSSFRGGMLVRITVQWQPGREATP